MIFSPSIVSVTSISLSFSTSISYFLGCGTSTLYLSTKFSTVFVKVVLLSCIESITIPFISPVCSSMTLCGKLFPPNISFAPSSINNV